MNRSFIERIVDDSTTGQINPSQEVLENLAKQLVEDIEDKGYPEFVKGTYDYEDPKTGITFSLDSYVFPYTTEVAAPDGKWTELTKIVPVEVKLLAFDSEGEEQPVDFSFKDIESILKGYYRV